MTRRRALFEELFVALIAPCKPAMKKQMLTDLGHAWRIDQAAVVAKDEAYRRASAVPPAKGGATTAAAPSPAASPHAPFIHALTVKVVAVCADRLTRLEAQYDAGMSPAQTPHNGSSMMGSSMMGSMKLAAAAARQPSTGPSTPLLPQDGAAGNSTGGLIILYGGDSQSMEPGDRGAIAHQSQTHSLGENVTVGGQASSFADEPQADHHPHRVASDGR